MKKRLPSKTCSECKRPFLCRKKWKKVCVLRWQKNHEAEVSLPIIAESTHEKTLEFIELVSRVNYLVRFGDN